MTDSNPPHRRRERYRGTHPRRFEQKYKELDPELDPATVEKVLLSGKTPAGQHRPILVDEILERLTPSPTARGADVTLGYGGHAEAILKRLGPDGRLLALDVDARQLPLTEARLRGLGFGDDRLIVRRSNYAGLASILPAIGWQEGVDFLLADLGLSSMQIDNPSRGFSYRHRGPLDMRLNPQAGPTARQWLAGTSTERIAEALAAGGDEPRAERIAEAIVASRGTRPLETTHHLRRIIEGALPELLDEDESSRTVTRVFQAVRIAVNDEFGALDQFLRMLPYCLRPGARVAILSFHSGEDGRVKRHFREGRNAGLYSEIAEQLIRPSAEEKRANLRSSAARLRWAIRG